MLGNWRPQNIIAGPKDSLFVACDTGYSAERGANSVYCYHIVTSQNTATGEVYTQNVYPVYANTRSREYHATLGSETRNNSGLQQTCAGMVLDHEDPPNLYYMTANTMYRIQPKGYSYQIGDTEIEQVFPERYFEDVLNARDNIPGILGRYRSPSLGGTADYHFETNFVSLQVDRRNRIYFPGYVENSQEPSLFCYSRGPNTSLLLYDNSNTEFSTLQVVANTSIYTANLSWDSFPDGTVDSIVLGASGANSAFNDATSFSEGVYFTFHHETIHPNVSSAGTTMINTKRLCVVYPNANGSFVQSEGGQLALTIMDDKPYDETRYETDGSGDNKGNNYRGSGPGKVVLRPEKL